MVKGVEDPELAHRQSLFREKGRYHAIFCGPEGRATYLLNKRDRTDGNRAFTALTRYDVVRFEGTNVREHDVQLAQDSTVTPLMRYD